MADADTISPERVEFAAPGGVRLVGDLRLPATADPATATADPATATADPAAGLVLTGPFTGVKEQVTGHYARALSQRGYATLAFDHRNFGESGGEPRQHEDPAGKALDLVAATGFLAAHDAVDADRVGCVGICLGGSYAVRHTAFDPRIRALALVAGGYNDPVAMQDGMGPDGYRAVMAAMADVIQAEIETGEVDYMAAVDDAGGEAAMGGDEPFEYYGTERSASPGWVNRVSRRSIRELLSLDAVSAGPLIGPRPTLMVHGRVDAYCTPEGAQAMYDSLGGPGAGPRELVWLDTSNHIDLYDNPVFVDPAVATVAAWFDEHLN